MIRFFSTKGEAMKTSLRLLVAVSLVAVAIGFAGGAVSAKAAGKKELVQLNLSDVKWKDMPNSPPGVQGAEVYKKGPAMECRFVKFPKGTEVPMHTHTHDIVGVVVAGTFGSTDEAGGGKPQPVGGFQNIPGGLKHTTKCTADADCIVFSCLPGPFDLKMPKAPGGKSG
jgi:quercetin dioxygenase-like cupin family protein